MKIAMYNVTTAVKIGGIETYNWEVAKELQKRGHDVEIISGKGNFIRYPEIKLKTFNFTPRKKIINLGHRFQKWGERMSFFKNAFSYLKKQKYDVFIIHKPFDFFITHIMKKINPNMKTVFVSGGEDFYGFDKQFAKSIDIMISVSKDNAEKVCKRYSRNATIVPNGVNIDLFKPNEKIRRKYKKRDNLENKKTLISIGRVEGWKGFQLVIEALKDLKEFQYMLVGKGRYLSKLRALARNLNVEDRVILLGEKPNNILPKYLNMAEIFVQPSIGNEAFGITILEAMSCGLPVIGSINGGIKEIVKDGCNGYLFDIGNVKDLKNKIIKAYNERHLLSQNAIKIVRKNFTWKINVDKLLSTINSNT